MSAAANAAPAEAIPLPTTGKKKLIILLAIALVVVLLAGGGAVWFFKHRAAAAAAAEAADEGSASAHAGAEKDGHRAAPIFVALDPFVVNLADKDAERYAQIGLTLEVEDAKFADEMKLYMPAIRNAILMILAHKSASELLDRAGKQALAAEIMRESVRPMGIDIDPPAPAASGVARKAPRETVHNPVRRVHFSSFIVQ
jgi:flagellar protein FliL